MHNSLVRVSKSGSEDNSSLEKWYQWPVAESFCYWLYFLKQKSLNAYHIYPYLDWKYKCTTYLLLMLSGVPKLNRMELETACEDFSNIIETTEGYTLYKGTLSSGVEICVASTSMTSLKDWSKRAELGFRKKVCLFASS